MTGKARGKEEEVSLDNSEDVVDQNQPRIKYI